MNKELRFDICEAWYLYAALYHAGQNCKLYSKLGQLDRMGFRPAPSLRYKSLTDQGKMIFRQLRDSKKYQ